MNKFIAVTVSIAVMMFSSAAYSSYTYFNIWNSMYPSSSSADNAGCQLCHASSTTYLNSYGEALCSSGAGYISNRILAVESADSDMDPTGSSNITEINNSTQPGWTPGNVNPVYYRDTCSPVGIVEAEPAIAANMDPDPVNQPPVANASGPYSGTVGVPLTFDGNASSDADGNIIAYQWDFGDDNTASIPAPTHTYMTDGNFTVTLTVTDDLGDSSTATITATIGLGNQPPVADPSDTYAGTTGVAVMFDGSASSDPDGSIISYSWNFGDGNSGYGATPSHTYSSDGIYNVTLQVMDDAGAIDSANTTTTISAQKTIESLDQASNCFSEKRKFSRDRHRTDIDKTDSRNWGHHRGLHSCNRNWRGKQRSALRSNHKHH